MLRMLKHYGTIPRLLPVRQPLGAAGMGAGRRSLLLTALCGLLAVTPATVWAKEAATPPLEIACLLAGRVLEVQQQPVSEVMVRLQLQAVRDDNSQRNDVECSKLFRVGRTLWVSLNAHRIAPELAPQARQRLWLALRAGDDQQQHVWRKYEVISSADYLSRKNGIR